MENICPICNALETIDSTCPRCGHKMQDGGALENFYGPYSPYMSVESMQYFEPDRQCVHLLYCPHCHYDTRAAWEMVTI